MQISSTARLSRIFPAALAAITLSMSIVPAMAAPTAVAKLNLKSFGHGVSLSATSQGTVTFSPQYSYSLQGVCEGTEDLAKIVKKGTSFASLLNFFSKGLSARLVGVVPPPIAPSTASIVEVPVKGSRKVQGLGTVTFSALLRCEVPRSGRVLFEVKNVEIKSAAGPLKGVFKMGPGSIVTVTAPPRVVCKLSGMTVAEDASVVNVVISRNINPAGTVTVSYGMEDGKAKAGVDYVAASGTVVFAPNETEKIVPVTIINNPLLSSDRWFRLKLTNVSSSPSGAYLGEKLQTNINILNKN